MKNRFFKSMFALVFAVMSAFVLTACAGKWDATKIKVGTTTFAYDGSSHVFEVDYEEAKVDVTVTYSTTATGEFKPASELSFVNVGTYSLYYKLTAEGFDDYVSAEPVEFTITVARITVNNETELATAITNYGTSSYVIVLGQDLVLTEKVYINSGEYTIDLNGHTVSFPSDTVGDGVFHVENTGKLTINDTVGTGVVNSASLTNDYSMAVWANRGGEVIINGGTFTNVGAKEYENNGTTPNNNDLIYASREGKITINGGTYVGNYENDIYGDNDTTGYVRFTLNEKDEKTSTAEIEAGTIVVTGGEFRQYDPADSHSENPAGNFVAEGYTSTEVTRAGITWYVVE